jgi:hypothetical protein
MIGLEFVTVARSADALKVFATVWITGVQSPDEPRWHNVVYVAPDCRLLEIHSTGFHLTHSAYGNNSMLLPSVPRRVWPWPFPV